MDELLKNKRIFIVEDDAYNIAIISAILRRAGADVFYERWGQETLEQLESSLPIDLIILDLMFPDADGYEIYDKIRQVDHMKDIPVVMVTAADPGREINRARELGMKGFIAKPINSQSFGQHIASVLDGKTVWVRDHEYY